MNLISLFISAMLVENVVLTRFLGLCPFVGVSSKEKSAIHMGISVTLVTVISSIITYAIYHLILVPTDTTYLINIMFVFIIAAFVQMLELILKKHFPKIHESLGIYLPLITTNCAVLGIVLLNINNKLNFLEMIIYSLGSSLGFTLVLYIFSTVRESLDKKSIHKNFKGFPIAMITIGIMALLFSRLMGK